MAIVKMRKISLLALIEDRSAILNLLQDSGAVQIITDEDELRLSSSENSEAHESNFADSSKDSQLNSKNAKDASEEALEYEESEEMEKFLGKTYFKNKEEIARQCERLDGYAQRLEKALVELRKRHPDLVPNQLPAHNHEDFFDTIKYKNEILDELIRLEEAFEEEKHAEQELLRLEHLKQELEPWADYDFNLSEMKSRQTAFLAGRVEDVNKLEDVKKKLANSCDFPYHIEEKSYTNSSADSSNPEQGSRLLRICCLKQNFPALKDVCSSSSMKLLDTEGLSGKPADFLEKNAKKIRAVKQELAALSDEIKRAAEDSQKFMALSDFYEIRIRRMNAEAKLKQSRFAFALKGFVPADKSQEIKEKIESQFTAAVYIRDLEEGEEFPIELKNRRFSKAYEVLLRMFGAPNVKELDPTPVLAPATFIFFGMMLSDVGYGIMLSLLCYYFVSKGKVKGENEQLCRMLFYSGISSTIWGFVFGGFFGNLIPTITNGRVATPCLWFDPMEDPMNLLIWSMIFGALHLFVGMAMKMINMIRQGDTLGAILDVVPWYLIITGLGLYGATSSAYPVWSKVGMYMAIFGAAVLVLTGGRDKKNIFLKFFSGLLKLYDITGYFGDILSYARVLALVLATSVIAQVVNQLGMMFGRTPIGYMIFAVVAVFGHTVNLALSALSAYVHSARLQYVEFFGKFFEGGGNFFDPLRLETKHIPIKKQ